jgi:uncharacterized membrane protein YczE
MIKRWLALFVGLIFFGIGIGLIIRGNLGQGPWDVLHQGISRQTGISIGMASILTGIPVVLAWWPLGQRPGWGTLANLIVIGVVVDIVLRAVPIATQVLNGAILLIGGILITGLGSGLYLSSAMGAGPRDGLMLGIARRTGWSVFVVRMLIELTVLGIGWILGGNVGIGTLAFAVGIGPVVQASLWLFKQMPNAISGEQSEEVPAAL